MSDDELISTDDAAHIIDRDASTVRRWLATGRLQGKKIGDVWLVYRSSAEAAQPPRPGRPRRRGLVS